MNVSDRRSQLRGPDATAPRQDCPHRPGAAPRRRRAHRAMTQAEPGYRPPDTSLLGAEHIRRYEETNGEVGHMWNGATALVLTTTGRKTGQPRKFALIYARDGNDYLGVASVG